MFLAFLACGVAPEVVAPPVPPATPVAVDPSVTERSRMVDEHIVARGIKDPAVVAAMRSVPRHLFVPEEHQAEAYADHPLPIGEEQTISQPYIVAFMTEALEVRAGHRVLEVGTGSGYQAAILAEMGAEVWSIEILPALTRQASASLSRTGYFERVHLRVGDGYRGWPDAAPFDRIIVTAAPDHVPLPLKEQLAVGGRLIVPVGNEFQELMLIERTPAGWNERAVLPVRFVPMTGEAQQ